MNSIHTSGWSPTDMPVSPEELLDMVERAVQQSTAMEMHLRRAVSTAYYVLFYTALRSVAEHLIGPPTSSAYAALYRRIEHCHILGVCKAVAAIHIVAPWNDRLGFTEPSDYLRTFAAGFKDLQQARHNAEDARTSVETARNTIDAFVRIPDAQRNAILLYIAIGRK